jgi:hypothetical protein
MSQNDSKKKPGQRAEEIKGDWEKAVSKSFRKKKPASGWPK